MKTRKIYKIVGEIELMNFDLEKNYKYHYEADERVVIDNIRIKYYGSLPCEYYSNDKYRKITNLKECSKNLHVWLFTLQEMKMMNMLKDVLIIYFQLVFNLFIFSFNNIII